MLSPESITAVLLAERMSLTAFIASVTRLVRDVLRSPRWHVVNWARMAGRNRAIDVMRSRDGKYVGLSEEMLAVLAQEWPERGRSEARYEALAHCLTQVTPNNRELLRLRYFEQRTCDVVAGLMNRKIETVYQALARLHKALSECIGARLQQEDAR